MSNKNKVLQSWEVCHAKQVKLGVEEFDDERLYLRMDVSYEEIVTLLFTYIHMSNIIIVVHHIIIIIVVWMRGITWISLS